MKKRPWILFVICVAVFVTLRLLSTKKEPQEASEKTKPFVPEPVVVQNDLLSHPWILTQPKVTELNIEMVRDLASLDEFCEEVRQQREDLAHEQIEEMLIRTLTMLQEQIPFALPESLYSVICITETPQEWVKAPIPFHVFKRLYLGEMEVGMPFYLDVRVFELEGESADDVIAWHLQTLDGEAVALNKSAYISKGYRTRDSAHGFAKGERGLYVDFIEHGGRLFVLYAEAPLKTFQEQEPLFKQLVQRSYD